jgi:hypothetical protein
VQGKSQESGAEATVQAAYVAVRPPRLQDAERSPTSMRRDPEVAAKLRIEERELEADGLN